MSYDKDSLLAGIAVGKQINGFWTGGVSIASADFGSLSDITVKSQAVTYVEKPAEGFYGIGSVTVLGDENLKPENIRQGVTILDVVGTYALPPSKEFRLQTKAVTITTNGSTTVGVDSGYDGLKQVRITTNVPVNPTYLDAKLQSKYVTPSANEQIITPDNGYDGLDRVTVNGSSTLKPENIKSGVTIFGVTGTFQEIKLTHKIVTPKASTQTVYPGTGFDALSYVDILGDAELISSNIREGVEIFGVTGSYSSGARYQEKIVTPASSSIRVTPDSGYNALAAVTVNTDSDLRAENIRNGVNIFGVTGTHKGNLKDITVFANEDEQYILPSEGYDGFSSITVAPLSGGGSGDASNAYKEGYQAGYDSRNDEVTKLEDNVSRLQQMVVDEYNRGFEDGREDVLSSLENYANGDEVYY